ncbi:hypothetical protein Tco_0735616 [Tanacetum coccineum]
MISDIIVNSRVLAELHLQSSSSHQFDSVFFPLLAPLQHIVELMSCDKMCCDINNVGFGEDDDGVEDKDFESVTVNS